MPFSLVGFFHTHNKAYSYSLVYFAGFCTTVRPSQPFTLVGPDVTKMYSLATHLICVSTKPACQKRWHTANWAVHYSTRRSSLIYGINEIVTIPRWRTIQSLNYH